MANRANNKEEQIARAKAMRLLGQVHSVGLLLKASVVRRRFRCGKSGCHCAKGHFHHDMVVTRKAQGKTQTIRVRKGREQEAVQWLKNWRVVKGLVDRLTSVEMDILRLPVAKPKARASKKARKRRGASRLNS